MYNLMNDVSRYPFTLLQYHLLMEYCNYVNARSTRLYNVITAPLSTFMLLTSLLPTETTDCTIINKIMEVFLNIF